MVAVRTSHGLADDLESLASALEAIDLRAALLIGSDSERIRDRLAHTIRSYLIPRLTDPDSPLFVVFAGPTGAGKSTLVNSLSGFNLSPTGPIRPTTKDPIVLTSEAAAERYQTVGGIECQVVTGRASILSSVALVDTPDIDSTYTRHRAMAETLIDNADVVVFVTSALRYADLVPWQVLRRAMSRGTPIIHVLNRVTAGSGGAEVDFRSRLTEAGVEGEIMRVPEHHLETGAQSVPALAVRKLGQHLLALAVDRERYRREVFHRVLDSTNDQISELAHRVGDDRRRIQDITEAMANDFADRVEGLDLSGIVAGLAMAEPPPTGALQRRRWLKANRLTTGELAHYTQRLRDRIVGVVESDLRTALLEEGMPVPGAADNPAGESVPLVRSAVDGWLEYAERIANRFRLRARPLATATLLTGVFRPEAGDVERLVLGEEGETLIGRARRELLKRLQVVYDQIGDRLAVSWRFMAGEPRADDLRSRAADVVARSHFADA